MLCSPASGPGWTTSVRSLRRSNWVSAKSPLPVSRVDVHDQVSYPAERGSRALDGHGHSAEASQSAKMLKAGIRHLRVAKIQLLQLCEPREMGQSLIRDRRALSPVQPFV